MTNLDMIETVLRKHREPIHYQYIPRLIRSEFGLIMNEHVVLGYLFNHPNRFRKLRTGVYVPIGR